MRSSSPIDLVFRDAYISEHYGEPVYVDKMDTLPVPELLMCKVAGLTKQIRMGAVVKLIHLAHPVDTAIQAAVTDHVIGGGRFIFGFGLGCPNHFSPTNGRSPSKTAIRACGNRSISF
jgi:alkanesulfonate monooxygenase SsuD/methylene tetrahydromethanopterin reductase-like flavin-dependent oxidoreductase (luciferase family)